MLLIFLSLLATITLPVVAFWYWRYFSFCKQLKNFKELKNYPVIGGLLHLIRATDPYSFLKHLHHQHGHTFWVMYGFNSVLATADPKLARAILSSKVNIKKSIPYEILSQHLGQGLINSTGEHWKLHRSILNHAFGIKSLKSYCKAFESCSEILVKQLEKHVNTSTDVSEYVELCVLDFICEMNFGASVKAQIGQGHAFLHSCIKEIARIMPLKLIKPIHNFFITNYFTNSYEVEVKNVKRYREFFEKVLPLKDSSDSNETSIMSLLLNHSGSKIPKEDVLDELRTFTAAGSETISSGVNFAIHLLAQNPIVQQNALTEILTVMDDHKHGPISFDDLLQMKYLELVIKETMRLFPSVPFIGRQLEEDFTFEGNVLSKGLHVLISLYVLLPKQGRDPEVFRPERFIDGDGADMSMLYFPFALGPRNCIGQKYAMLAMKSLLAKILLNFELKTVGHEIDLSMDAVLRPENGVVVELRKRIL